MSDVVVCLSTASNDEEAGKIARALVEEELAACVNLVPGVRSVYRWQGKIEDGPEVLLVIKTRRSRLDALLPRLKALLRVGEQSNVNLQEFLAKEQIEGASHEKRKIGLAHDKVKSIVLESESCVSETGATGRTVVHVEKPDDVGDPTNLDGRNEGLDDLETLPSASPYN